MKEPFTVLSIDGGGIRGMIPALLLAEMERRTGQSIARLFDLVAGTSAGGVIALGLTKPDATGDPEYSSEEVAQWFYAGRGKRSFSAPILHQLSSAWGLLEEKYPADQLERAFDETFGEARLKDALTNVFVTAFAIELRSPWFFRSHRARTETERDFPMKKVARATSAAPMYFEPLRLEGEGGDVGKSWGLVDGGVYANNPTMCALVEARTAFGANDVLVVSLGTGEPTAPIEWKDARNWGRLSWMQPLLDIVFEGNSDTVAFQTEQLCPPRAGRRRYYRFQVQLPELKTAVDDIEDARNKTIEHLREVTVELIRRRSADLDELCRTLKEIAPASVS
jgi:patatin-like phospholipase/acyl hydrolase